MFNIIKFMFQKCFSKTLLISYEKMTTIPAIKTGYVDIDTVVKRYKDIDKNITFQELLKDQTINDNFYFMESECKKCFVNLDPKAKLIDIGCGNGLYSRVFQRKASIFKEMEYYGCEIDKKLVRVCSSINPMGNFFVSKAEKITSKNNNFDLVFCSSTIHYTLSNWRNSIDEMARVSNGFVAITRFPITKYNSTFYVHQKVKGINGTENHYFTVINRQEFEGYCSKIGLKIMKRDYSSEEYKIKGINEKIMLVQYLFEKRKN